jgi:hypothetical protein
LSYGVHVVGHTYYATPQATLDVGVQDDVHQALTTLCQKLRDLNSQ